MAGRKPGPRPQPTRVRELNGNPGKRKIKAEPVPDDASTKSPGHLSPKAADFWKAHAGQLSRLGLLTVSDVESFGFCCEAWAAAQSAKSELRASAKAELKLLTEDKAHGGDLRTHPAWRVYRQAEASYLVWAKEFGLTPSARVGLPAPDDDDEDDDIFDT